MTDVYFEDIDFSEDEYEEEHHYVSEWPQTYVSRPPLTSLVAFHAAHFEKPPPLDEKIIEWARENNEACAKAKLVIESADAIILKLTTEIATIEAASKGLNKWSSAATTSAPVLKRLQGELTTANEKKRLAVAAYDKIFSQGETCRSLLSIQTKQEENWEAYSKLISQ